jgi:uncharacterized membrane protein
MTLAEPFWLILLIPLAMALWLWRMPSRLLLDLRLAVLVALLLAVCGLSVRLPARSGSVVLVCDRSLSMPPDAHALEKEAADLLDKTRGDADKLAVVSFAQRAEIEQSPQQGKSVSFSAEVGSEASNLADALDKALSLIGPDDSGRILLISDGLWTGRDPAAAAARAAAAGVAIDYRCLQRPAAGDLAIERLQAPESVLPGESYMITAWIRSPKPQQANYKLLRGGQVIAEGATELAAGTGRLVFRDTAARGGVSEYQLRVEAAGDDPLPGNNRARLMVGVRGQRPLLCVAPARRSALPDLLARGGVELQFRTAAECAWSLEELAGYSAVLLENTPAGLIGHAGMQNLGAWVAQVGGGMMLTGGRQSFGAGGYFKSPLDPLLPVSMELRREHRKLSLAIVVALDRSGSMAVSVPGGRTKMDLADLATAEVLEMLGPMDQFGCLAVDSIPHEIVPLGDVTDKGPMREKILRIDSLGGGIFIYEALAAAARMIQPAKAGTRHIILFADAADSEEPGDYKKLVDALVKAGVSISVIGLGTEKDCDAELLKDIARRGGGQCMFTNVAQDLPRLFAQDTCVIARSALIDEATKVHATGGMAMLTRQPLGAMPEIGGYNLCYLRPEATLAVVSEDEYQAPVVACWQAGMGRVLCYTGEADGQYTGPIAKWDKVGDFFASMARWTAGKDQGLGPGMAATEELRGGVCRVELHLDPDRKELPFQRLPELSWLAARPGEAATGHNTRMTWSSPDTLLAEAPLSGDETLLPTVEAAGAGRATLAPMCMPYSPEYEPREPSFGVAALERLAKATGGRQRIALSDVWKDIPRRPRNMPLAPYLFLAATGLLLVEVFQRRTGLLSLVWMPLVALFRRRRNKQVEPSPREEPAAKKPAEKKPAAAIAKQQTVKSKSQLPPAAPAIDDALEQARRRAKQRTKR